MKRRYLRAIPVLSMLILCQAVSFIPAKADLNVDVLETFTIESLVDSVSDVFVPQVQAKADWNDLPSEQYGEDTQAWKDTEKAEGTTPTTPTNPNSNTSDGKIVNNTKDILIVVNGSILGTDQPPYVVSNRTMVPIRAISEGLGAKVKWDNNTKTFEITSKDGKIVIKGTAGKSQVTVNGETKYIDSNAKNVVVEQKNGRVFAPLRFFAENLGCEVSYQDRVVYIATK